MPSRHSAPRLLVVSAGISRPFRPISLLHRTFASIAPLKQAASTSSASTQATEEPPKNAVDTPRKKRDTDKTQRARAVRTKVHPSHYIDPLKPQVSLRTKNGRELTLNLTPTPKANVEKLTKAVRSLCSSKRPADNRVKSKRYTVGRLHWSLAKNGNAIFRLLAVKSSKEGNEITSRIQKAADEMNHHPTIISLEPEAPHTPWHMCVINTTHHPRGLGMRDIRLALAIDSILQDYDVERSIIDPEHGQAAAILGRASTKIWTRVQEATEDPVATTTATPDASKSGPEQTDNNAG